MNPRPSIGPAWSKTNVAERLRLLRAAIGLLQKPPRKLTQTDFARRAGLTQGGYTQYENAIRVPSIAAAVKLRSTYGVTLDWLYTGDELHMPFDIIDAMRRAEKAKD